MLTHLTIRNFKRFGRVDIELGDSVVFIGPNNSGKTTALQALALWEIGLKRWCERRSGKGGVKEREGGKERPGVAINRRDIVAVPVPDSKLLWRNLFVRDVQRIDGKPLTRNVRMEILVEWVANGRAGRCGLEFDYANEESL
jgi:predicted ATPase